MIISIVLGILLNLVFLIAVTWNQGKDSSGWQQAEEVRQPLVFEGGSYVLSEEGEKVLEQTGAWGILVENDTGNVIWSSTGLAPGDPDTLHPGEISWAVRGYIRDYPHYSVSKN